MQQIKQKHKLWKSFTNCPNKFYTRIFYLKILHTYITTTTTATSHESKEAKERSERRGENKTKQKHRQ